MKCSKISNPDNGRASGDNRIGSTVYFTCNNNYVLVGPSNVTCQANGEWTAPSSVCIRLTCSYPGDVVNGINYYIIYIIYNKLFTNYTTYRNVKRSFSW